MSKALDMSWFDLKNYEPFKNMSIEDWIWQLEQRYQCYRLSDPGDTYAMDMEMLSRHGEYELQRYLSATLAELKKGVIPGRPNYKEIYSEDVTSLDQPLSTVSVKGLSIWQLWLMVREIEHLPAWKACQKLDEDGYITSNRQLKLISMPYDLYYYQHNGYSDNAIVTVDLAPTDDQIGQDFYQRLKEYRKAINYHQCQQKLFTQDDFDYWIKYRVVPYLDLMIIAKNEGKKVTQPIMANLLFPDEYERGIVDRLRKVTIPEAERIINSEIHKSLLAQFLKNGMKKT